jgi:hypothetical protein
MLLALDTLSAAQPQGTQATANAAARLLNYAATHPGVTIHYNASTMILHNHSDASYLSEAQTRSRAGGYFFLSSDPDSDPYPPPQWRNSCRLQHHAAQRSRLCR